MRKLFTLLFLLCSVIVLNAQTQYPPLDKSPLDVVYYPAAYPILKIQDKTTDLPSARVMYSRPQKNGRNIFGDLVEFGTVWRLGANEATELELFKPARIGNTKLKKGRYSLFCIPNADKWTIIVNKDTDTWGAFKYSKDKDVVRVDVPTQKTTSVVEIFTMQFEKTETGIGLSMAWDDTRVVLPISF